MELFHQYEDLIKNIVDLYDKNYRNMHMERGALHLFM